MNKRFKTIQKHVSIGLLIVGIICITVADVKAQKQPIRTYIPTGDNSASLHIYNAAISPDGTKLAMVGNSQIVRIFDVNTGIVVQTLERHSNLIQSVAFSHDSKWAITGGWDRKALLWDLETGTIIQSFFNPDSPDPTMDFVYGVAISPNRKNVITSQVRNAILWDIQTGEKVRTYSEILNAGAREMIFSPDGNRVYIKSWEEGIILDILSGKVLQLYDYNSVDISNDFQHILAANDSLLILDTNQGMLVHDYRSKLIGKDLDISSDENNILYLHQDNVILENISVNEGRQVLWTVPRMDSEPYRRAMFLPDGNRILTFTKNTAYLWDIRDLMSSVKNATEVNR